MRCAGTFLAALLASASPALAQNAAPRPRSFEVSASALALGGIDFGNQNAKLTGNEPGNPDFTLFATSSKLDMGAGLDASVTFNVSRAFGIEGTFTWTRETAETTITSDAEGVPNFTITEDLSTYFVEAAAVFHFNSLQFARGHGVPFVFGGGGYLRQLDGESILIDTGTVFHAGGGVKYFFTTRPRGFVRGFGLRADGRVYVRSGGLDLSSDEGRRTENEGRWRPTWAVAGGLVVRF